MTERVVVVTGGGRGIGAATARAFAARGDRVAVGDVDAASAAEVAGPLGGYAGALDVRDRAGFAAFLAAVAERLGPVDVLVNNAGVASVGDFLDTGPDRHDLVLDVNVRGVAHGMAAALPAMVARGRGHVVNVASLAGRLPFPGGAMYVASKHAVLGLTAAVRAELFGTGVYLTAVLPTFVRTDLVAGLALTGVPTVTAADVAAAVVAATTRRRPPAQVTVPRRLTGVGAFYSALPQWLRDAAARPRGERPDQAARADYERRLDALGRGDP
jgi:hypothetical protein